MKNIITIGEHTMIMGVLNVTPDSFYDGGKYLSTNDALAQAKRLVEDGADVIDVGGESTRPFSDPVPEDVEVARVIPVVEALAKELPVPISVDTYKSRVAALAMEAGATMINDISGLKKDRDMVKVVAETGAHVIIMHSKGDPKHMQENVFYTNVVEEVRDTLQQRAEKAIDAGISPNKIWLDPGFGFGKMVPHNLDLLRDLSVLCDLGFPVLVGTSNKSMIGETLGVPVGERLEGTAATVAAAVLAGASGVRVHDVKLMRRVAMMADAIAGRGQFGYEDRLRTQSVFVSLGSNIGDRLHFLRDGIRALHQSAGIRVVRTSKVYETDPVGPVDQPLFLNIVAELETSLSPMDLLDQCQRVEKEFGRTRDVRFGPRTLDVDILLMGTRSICTERLKVPHERMHERAFVLQPLAELDSEMTLRGKPVRSWLEQIRSEGGQAVRTFEETTGWID